MFELLPWPPPEVAYGISRINRALADHPGRAEIASGFLLRLAERGDPQHGLPVTSLRGWLKHQPVGRLRGYALAFELEALADREAGVPRRRGDIARMRTKGLPAWWSMNK